MRPCGFPDLRRRGAVPTPARGWRTLTAIGIFAFLCRTVEAGGSPAKEFPFELRDGLIWVQVQFQKSAVPQNFLLDSGAGLSVINLPSLSRMGGLSGRRVVVRGVGTSTTGYYPQHLISREGSLPLPDYLLAVDLTELGRACKRTVDGLVGADFFDDHVVQVNFANRMIRLLPSSECITNGVVLPIEVQNRAFRVPIRVNEGLAQWFRLDTGCAAALHWVGTPDCAQDCKPGISVALTTLTINMTHATVELGGLRFDAVPTAFHEKPIFVGEAGLLGNGLLARFNSIIIDASAGRVVLAGPRRP